MSAHVIKGGCHATGKGGQKVVCSNPAAGGSVGSVWVLLLPPTVSTHADLDWPSV